MVWKLPSLSLVPMHVFPLYGNVNSRNISGESITAKELGEDLQGYGSKSFKSLPSGLIEKADVRHGLF